MRSLNLLLLMLTVSICSYGQISFEKGYYINNDNQKIECLIKNKDWKNNPKEFEFVLNENDVPQNGDLTLVKEFGVYSYSKFVRADVQIDRSPGKLSELSTVKSPIWSNEQLFLKVLVEGKASLYKYSESNFDRYFYSKSDSLIQQLIYKEYLVQNSASGRNDEVSTNNAFRQQLWLDVTCPNASMSQVENLVYQQQDLEKYFQKYNECNGEPKTVYHKNENRNVFNLSLVPGVNYTSYLYSDYYYGTSMVLDKQFTYRIGVEAEFVLPFKKNKWSIVIEPTYQYCNYEEKASYNHFKVKLHHPSIDFPIGIRHYFFLTEKSKIFIDGFFVTSHSINFDTEVYAGEIPLTEIDRDSYAFGIGFSYSKLNAEFRYNSKREFTGNSNVFIGYSSYSFLVGYRLFRK